MNCGRVLNAVAASVGLGLAGCAMEARTDHDPKLASVSCHSYEFADPQPGAVPAASAFDNPLNAKRLREAVASSLAVRHLPPAADGTHADCLVSYAIGSRLEPDPWVSPSAWGYDAVPPLGLGGRYYGYGYGYGGSVIWAAPYAYRQGRVTVDLYDARTHEALWHAYVDADVTELTGSEADQRIRAAVATIFEQFPPVAPTAAGPAANKS
jgi:Domain of unknown function (DUF4136)